MILWLTPAGGITHFTFAPETGANSRNRYPYFLGIRILREQVNKSRELGKVLSVVVITEIPLLLSLLSGQEKISVVLLTSLSPAKSLAHSRWFTFHELIMQ